MLSRVSIIKKLFKRDLGYTWNLEEAVIDFEIAISNAIKEVFPKITGCRFHLVQAWTKKAMAGNMTFQEALKLRLDIIQPTVEQVKDFLKKSPPTLTPGVSNLVKLLRSKGIDVYLISGGFKCIIAPIADQLNIPYENIYANRLKFYFGGSYAGFDENEPTSRSGGKAVVVDLLKKKKGYKNLILIGDGATDLEACPPADGFIGFGGNVIRPKVQANAKWFVTDFNEIINVLES